MDLENSPSNRTNGTWAPGYRVIRSLHRSDSTQIFAAVRETSGIEAALKVVAKPERARREISTLRTLADAPGVVPLMDAGRTTMGHEFLVLPLYPDGSLGQVLGRSGPASLQQTVAVGRSVGAALANLHNKGLLHNAVAPENILAGNTSLLTGFSAVIRTGAQGVPVRSTESFLHAPPEAFQGEHLVPASDVYRLASTLWTLLMGRTPFSRESGAPLDNAAYMERVLSMDTPRVEHRDVSRVLSRVLIRAMAKDPEERYQNAGEFALALERARTGTTGTGGSPVPSNAGPSEVPPAPPSEAAPPPVPGAPVEQGPSSARPHTLPEPLRGPGDEEAAAPDAPPEAPAEHLPAEAGSSGTGREPEAEPTTATDDVPEPTVEATAEPSGPTSASLSTIGPVPAQWKALEGWTGDSGTRLPGGGSGATDEWEDDPVWNELDEEPRWRKHLNIAVAASGVLLFTGAVGVVMAAQPDIDGSALASATESTEEEAGGGTEDTDDPVPVEPSPPPALDEPTDVVLDDNGDSVTLNWSDNSGGTASYFVLGGQQDHDPSTLARTGPGAVTTQVSTDVPNSEYCFTVIAVEGTAAPSDEVCTTRAADRAEAERQAEEEAEEEREEEEDEDADEEEEDDTSGSGGGGSGSDDSGSGGSGSGGSGSSGGSGD